MPLSCRWIGVGLAAVCLALPVSAQTGPALSDAQLRYDEMQIEVAWTADPATFPYQLVALTEGSVMKVYGQVPNGTVAAQALKLARENTTLNVMDVMQIRPSLGPRVGAVAAESLQKAAVQALTEAFPGQARNLSVRTDAQGRITVMGALPSYEDQRSVGRRLKPLRGCTSVVNQVQVTPVLRQGRNCVAVSSDGRLLLALNQESADAPPPSQVVQASYNAPASAPFPTAQTIPTTAPAGGVVRAGYEVPATVAPSVTPASASQTPPEGPFSPLKLKRRLERVCGMAAREIHVMGDSASGLRIRIKARNEEEGQRLFDQVMQLPELAPYQVKLQIQAER